MDEQLADRLLGKAAAEGVELLGPDGLLSQVTKAVLERALAEEMTGHLGYEKHERAFRLLRSLANRPKPPAPPPCPGTHPHPGQPSQ